MELYEENENEQMEIMERDIELHKETINNLNFIIGTLKESNKTLTMEIMNLDNELEEKNEVMDLFLKKHNLCIEDVLEFEMELKTKNSFIIESKES